MMFKLSTLINLFLFAAAVAVPASRPEARLVCLVNRRSRPTSRIDAATRSDSSCITEYDSSFAGAGWNEGNGTFATISGTFNVPAVSDGSAVTVWLTIDGVTDSCETAFFLGGVQSTVTNGGISYEAFYEWYPELAYAFSGITVSAGDEIMFNVITSATFGTIVFENLSTGQSVTQNVTSSYPLCGQSAGWFVGYLGENDSLDPLADFGTVTYTDASASGPSGKTYTPSGATIFDIEEGDEIITSVSTSGDNMTINYI